MVHAGGADVGVKDPVVLVAAGGGLAASSPHEDGALRYATAVARPGGGLRWYAEVAHADGSHDLVTSVSPSPGET